MSKFYISRLELQLTHLPGPRALPCPQSRLCAALADTHFALKLDIDLLGMIIRQLGGLHFLKKVPFEFRLLVRIGVRAR